MHGTTNIKFMTFFNTQISLSPCHFFLLGPDILIRLLFSDTLSIPSFLHVHFALMKNTQYTFAFG